MAVIATVEDHAVVQAKGAALDATVNLSGALMEMLATIYVYLLMGAIREAIQNGSDAARRNGLSFADGVLVELPTKENPFITVIDRGTGMTNAFMCTTYLSFGSSTKAGSDDAAGGLGVGRWAAYGYGREAYITTTANDPDFHAELVTLADQLALYDPDDTVTWRSVEWKAAELQAFIKPCLASPLIEQTFFQYQGPDGKPKVQLATLAAGETLGTRVYFPVKESDIDEAYRAVAWLKGVMQLTMGDSFSVDKPTLLPKVLPAWSGHKLDLGTVDDGLKGIFVYPMLGSALQYSRDGIASGSLVVLTNKELGYGGLPFHVREASPDSIFAKGMVVEVPMRYRVPFMPSREEVKYTDEVNALFKRINHAAHELMIAQARELYYRAGLKAKASLSHLIGGSAFNSTEQWHSFVYANKEMKAFWHKPLIAALDGHIWSGSFVLPRVSEMSRDLTLKSIGFGGVFTTVHYSGTDLAIAGDKKGLLIPLKCSTDEPVTLVVNDLKSGGTARFRAWLKATSGKGPYLYFSSEKPGEAAAAAAALNARFGSELDVLLTSTLPTAPRVIRRGKVVKRSSGGGLLYYCRNEEKQVTAPLGFESPLVLGERRRVWLGRNGSTLSGFQPTVMMRDLLPTYSPGSLLGLMKALQQDRLYLLSDKQVEALAKMQAEATDSGLMELEKDEFEEDADLTYDEVQALKSWLPFEEWLAMIVELPEVQEVLAGTRVRKATDSWELRNLIAGLVKAPRLSLTGTRFDKAIAPYVDVVAGGPSRVFTSADSAKPYVAVCEALILLGTKLEVQDSDPQARKDLVAKMQSLEKAGLANYPEVWANLRRQFPLLKTVTINDMSGNDAIEHLCLALAMLYR